MTLAKFAYSLVTTAYGVAKIVLFSGEIAMPSGRVLRVCPAGRRSIQLFTLRWLVSTTATRESG